MLYEFIYKFFEIWSRDLRLSLKFSRLWTALLAACVHTVGANLPCTYMRENHVRTALARAYWQTQREYSRCPYECKWRRWQRSCLAISPASIVSSTWNLEMMIGSFVIVVAARASIQIMAFYMCALCMSRAESRTAQGRKMIYNICTDGYGAICARMLTKCSNLLVFLFFSET